jgi:Family of unknown function (DUF6401)
MPDPRPLSAAGLRLAGEVGQATLNRVAADGAAVQADLDQHVAAVRAVMTECQSARGREASAVARHAAVDARVGPSACSGLGELLSATTRGCPDVPFVADACSREPSPPLALLLHYLCGFVEGAVTRDWWPAADRDSLPVDWESMRIAAVCKLISAAEAESELDPDLHKRPLADARPADRSPAGRLAPGQAAFVPARPTARRGAGETVADLVPLHPRWSCASAPPSG